MYKNRESIASLKTVQNIWGIRASIFSSGLWGTVYSERKRPLIIIYAPFTGRLMSKKTDVAEGAFKLYIVEHA